MYTGNSLSHRHKQIGVRRPRVAAGGDYPSGAEWCYRFVVSLMSHSTGGITAVCRACRLCPREACQPEEQLHWCVFLSHGMPLCAAQPHLTTGCDVVKDGNNAETSAFESTVWQRLKGLINHRGEWLCISCQQLFGILSNCLHPPERHIHRYVCTACLHLPSTPNPGCGAHSRAQKSQIAWGRVCSITGSVERATVNRNSGWEAGIVSKGLVRNSVLD